MVHLWLLVVRLNNSWMFTFTKSLLTFAQQGGFVNYYAGYGISVTTLLRGLRLLEIVRAKVRQIYLISDPLSLFLEVLISGRRRHLRVRQLSMQ